MGMMLKGFLNTMAYKYFSSIINKFHSIGLFNLLMSLLEIKHNTIGLFQSNASIFVSYFTTEI